jgi:hypothetical protein
LEKKICSYKYILHHSRCNGCCLVGKVASWHTWHLLSHQIKTCTSSSKVGGSSTSQRWTVDHLVFVILLMSHTWWHCDALDSYSTCRTGVHGDTEKRLWTSPRRARWGHGWRPIAPRLGKCGSSQSRVDTWLAVLVICGMVPNSCTILDKINSLVPPLSRSKFLHQSSLFYHPSK